MNPGTYVDSIPDMRMPGEIRAWLRRMFGSQPDHIAGALATRHDRTTAEGIRAGRPNPTRPANIELREYVEGTKWMLPPNASEDQLRTWAKHRAEGCRQSMRRVNGDEMDTYTVGHGVVTRFGLEAPTPKGAVTLQGCINRMADELWWRRQARNFHGRKQEREARTLGLVHKNAGLYISHDGFKRWRGRQLANARTLADSVAVCETGEEFTLAEIAETGLANPRNRRNELMGRIAGTEQYAKKQGHVALFVTLTVPAGLHAVDSRSLKPGRGRNVTPREAQEWLTTQWARTRTKLRRDGVYVYGLRVAEPHHDGTPHWHALLFVDPTRLVTLRNILTHYALDGATDKARKKHACKLINIDPERGSATGYVAKYVAKAIDGFGLDFTTALDDDGHQAAVGIDSNEAANRVRAWASQWGIRQFQFIGTPAIGPWRELRRLDEIKGNSQAEALRAAADESDYARYIELMGGTNVTAKDRPARVRYVTDVEYGRYGEPKTRPYIEAFGQPYTSRPLRWEIVYRPDTTMPASHSGEAASTWTRGNNCTQPLETPVSLRSPEGLPATVLDLHAAQGGCRRQQLREARWPSSSSTDNGGLRR